MPISFNIELSDQEIERLRQAVKTKPHATDKAAIEATTAAAIKLIEDATRGEVPGFIATRLHKLDKMIAMVRDDGWALEPADLDRVLSALNYFVDPDDIIADNVPVIGFLDDAIMIEISERELEPELVAYDEFCAFRHDEAAQRGLDPSKVGRADWLAERRTELHDRMRRWHSRDYGEGYGDSSGYKAKTTYVGNAWRPSLFRTT
ncbi:MAG: DUF1232 domain-containing protein [Proteobacteria bacterium]|nr:DUF1232 domain-containing protein [Pseudomonadota bacterium]